MRQFVQKKFLIPVAIIIMIISILSFFSAQISKKESTQSPTPTTVQTTTEVGTRTIQNGISISPDLEKQLDPNTTTQFIITLPPPLKPADVIISMLEKDITTDKAAISIQFSQSSPDNRMLIIAPQNPIAPHREYSISITKITDNLLLFFARYTSSFVSPTPIAINNKALIPYLPYETSSFKLSYDSEKNVYVFSFKFNSGSPDDLDAQFSRAKQQAIQFIQSKGVDSNSMVINWNYH